MGNCSTCEKCGSEDTQGEEQPGSANTEQPYNPRRPTTKAVKSTSVQVAEDSISISERYKTEESVQSEDDNQPQDIQMITPGIANGLSVPADAVDSTLGGIIHWRNMAELSALMSRDIKLKVWNEVFRAEQDHLQPEHKRATGPL